MENPQKYIKTRQNSLSRRIKKLMEYENIQVKQLADALQISESKTRDLIEAPNCFSIEDIFKLETIFNDSIILIPFYQNQANLVKNPKNTPASKSQQYLQHLSVNKPLDNRKQTNDIDKLTPNEIAEKPRTLQNIPNQTISQLIDNKK